ncbi:MAG TPA: sigma-54 dependent transcriptional regulator [Acidobacteriota bacterium]|nr:sigma-54 dependent transcriptional regulator [Acidobacteriota bacterium]
MKSRVLIVDDEERMAEAVAKALLRDGHECHVATSGRSALQAYDKQSADVVISDLRMPEMDGLQLMDELLKRDRDLPVILITAYSEVRSAVEAMRRGAFDYLSKPFDNSELRSLVERALRLNRLERENRLLRREVGRQYHSRIIAESGLMKEALDLVDRAAPSKAPVLIEGESGTGKELVARRLHYYSDRVGRPLVAVNCRAFAEGVLESELFGHEKGSFSGAVQSRQGCFERAHGGTLFLDEIGDISPEFQAKLLRVLQEGEVLRVGGSQSRKVDVRVVSASNRDLAREVAEGRFREDLYFRLNVIPVRLAPLRKRREDILPLAEHFLARQTRAGEDFQLEEDARQALVEHSWPGNVRELENVIERAAVLSPSRRIEREDLLFDKLPSTASSDEPESRGGTLQETLDAAVVARIREALESTGGRKAEAADQLGIDRTTLYRLIKRHAIET